MIHYNWGGRNSFVDLVQSRELGRPDTWLKICVDMVLGASVTNRWCSLRSETWEVLLTTREIAPRRRENSLALSGSDSRELTRITLRIRLHLSLH